MKYPEHEKLTKIHHLSQACGEFLDWLRDEKGIILVTENTDCDSRADYVPAMCSTQELLEEHFGIDAKRLEAEKRAMLDECRKAKR